MAWAGYHAAPMLYRPLGLTGLNISAITLGGHWRLPDGRRYCASFPGDQAPAEVVKNRREVVAAADRAGINAIDITTPAECLAYGAALEKRRDLFIIGADHYMGSARNRECCRPDRLMATVETCLSQLRTDRLDIWRVTGDMHGANTPADMEAVLDAAERLRSAGKIRFLGLSSHHPRWLNGILAEYPAFQVLLHPVFPGSLRPEHCPPGMCIGIKPLLGGLLTADVGEDTASRIADMSLRAILHSPDAPASIAIGLTTPAEVAAAVSAEAAGPPNEAEAIPLATHLRSVLAALPDDYTWLRAWADCARTET